MDNKISTILVISVAIIVVGSLMMPIIINANDDAQVVKTNVGDYADILNHSADANLTLAFDGSTGAYTINGETQTISGYGVLALSDQFRIGHNGSSVLWAYYDDTGSHWGFEQSAITTFNLSIVNGVMTLTVGEDVVEVGWSKLAYLTNDISDDYVVNIYLSGNTEVYINSLDQLMACDLVDGEVVSYIDREIKSSMDAVITEHIITTDVNRAENMFYVLGGPDGTIDVSVENVDYALKYVCMPNVVTSDTITSDALALTFVAPVLVLVALIAAAIGMFARRY